MEQRNAKNSARRRLVTSQARDCGTAPAARDLVSVIVPSFNRVDLLHELLGSLRAQHWRPLEVIVIDDGSTDGTVSSLKSLWDDEAGLELKILSQPNRGPASARNRGLEAALGDYIYLIDSDDLVEPDGIKLMADALAATGAPYCVAQVRSVDARGNPLPFNDGNLSRIDSRSILGSRWAIHTALYRRSVFEKAGTFDERLRMGEDSELRWRIVATNGPGILLDATVAVFRRHGGGQVTDDNTPVQMGRGMLHPIDSFCSWAKPRGILTAPVRRQASKLLMIAAIRLGSGGDWEGKRRAIALAHTIDPTPARALLRLSLLESRLFYRALELASRGARRALHMSRSKSYARIAKSQRTNDSRKS